MKPIIVLGICLFLFTSNVLAERPLPLLVSTAWLSDHLNDADLVVLHVGYSRPEYREAGHIPGARFLWYNWLVISTPDLSTELPPLTQADTVLESLGITFSSKIVLCFTGTNIIAATRILLTLSYFGFQDQVALLDGGFDAWKAAQKPISKEQPLFKRTSLTLTPHPEFVVDAAYVQSHLRSAGCSVVDARARNFYDGKAGGIVRAGHVAGAKSIPYSAIIDSTIKMKDITTLKKLFDDEGIKEGGTIVTYCHSGGQATLVQFAARLLGYKTSLYDGSFDDWSWKDETYSVEKTELPMKK